MFKMSDLARLANASPLAASLASFALTGAAFAVVIAPAAAGAVEVAVTSVACSATSACVSGTNKSSGPGVSGTSAKGAGVSGVSTSSYGVSGTSKSGVGVKAVSSTSSAILATNNASSYPTLNVQQNGKGIAIEATSKHGEAIEASSGNGTGLEANTANGNAIEASSQNGDGLDANTANGNGIEASSKNGNGLVARATSGTGVEATGDTFGILTQTTAGTSYPLAAVSPNGNFVAYIDEGGDFYSTGSYYTIAATAAGDVRTYGASATTPTVEDVGASVLRGGTVRVSLDPTFAHSIDGTGPYHVFLTPAGDTRGLFVAERDRSGFVVREAQGGRSSIGFDYRIVATTIGHARERMSLVDRNSEPRAPRMDSHKLRVPVRI